MSKYLIAGLGNIGDEYQQTRHNIGFLVADELVRLAGEKFTIDRLASIVTIKYKGKTLVVIKPSTYMNLSGKAINYWMQSEHIPKSNVLVVTDDLALPFGKLRMKTKGSDGGHNGLKSIQDTLQSIDYSRLRFGIGNEFARGKQVDYVLGEWSAEEKTNLSERIAVAVEMIKSFATIGPERTMTHFNNK